jgi:Ca2+-binding EF-hand superfamily protein
VKASYTNDELTDMLMAADTDKDDAINLQEFVHVVTKQYTA